MKILLPAHMLETLRDPVSQIAPGCTLVPVHPAEVPSADLSDAEVLFLPWGFDHSSLEPLLARLPRLRWVHTISAGVDHILLPALAAPNVVLTNARGVFSVPIAETVLAYMLAVVKRLPEFLRQQQAHRWHKLELRELDGLTVGIVGLGDIGREVARRCRALGMRVLGLRRDAGPDTDADEVLPPARLHDLLARADFVVIALPLTPQTRGLIDQAALAAMKPDAWLINISRGAVIEEAALIAALREGRIGGACLDVFAEEPLPAENPLWDLPNVIITPHNSWSSPRLEARQVSLFLENLRRYVAGEPLLNVVDPEAGY